MKTRSDYDAALDVVASVINAWHPYSLIEGGSPSDEFGAEIAALVSRIRHIHSEGDAAREIATVFEPTFTPEACAKVGEQPTRFGAKERQLRGAGVRLPTR